MEKWPNAAQPTSTATRLMARPNRMRGSDAGTGSARKQATGLRQGKSDGQHHDQPNDCEIHEPIFVTHEKGFEPDPHAAVTYVATAFDVIRSGQRGSPHRGDRLCIARNEFDFFRRRDTGL